MDNIAAPRGTEGFRSDGLDLVTSWVGNLLSSSEEDGKEKSSIDTVKPVSLNSQKESAQIIAYPIDRILSHGKADAVIVSPEEFCLEEVKKRDILPIIKIDPNKKSSYFTFTSGVSFYGLPVENINEIIRYQEPVNISSKKAGLLGLLHYRTRIIPIYNFSSIVAAPIESKTVFKFIIVCIYENKMFGLAVRNIKNIMKIKNKNLIASATFRFWGSNAICSDVFEDEAERFYSVVDVKSVYDYLKT